jgi:hypothetical protein
MQRLLDKDQTSYSNNLDALRLGLKGYDHLEVVKSNQDSNISQISTI